MPQGDVILAPKGEKMVRHYSFYSAFASGSDYSVLHRSVPIGTLPADSLPRPNDHFLLGTKRWQVVKIDDSRREVIVKRAHGKKPPKFFGGGGEIHRRVREKMKEVVCGEKQLGYLDDAATQLLREARDTARTSKLQHSNIVELSPGRSLWFTWTGTRIQRTLCLLAEQNGLACTDRDIAIEFEATGADDLINQLPRLASDGIDPVKLAHLLSSKQFRKLDELLSEDLLCESLASDFLDVEGAVLRIKTTNS